MLLLLGGHQRRERKWLNHQARIVLCQLPQNQQLCIFLLGWQVAQTNLSHFILSTHSLLANLHYHRPPPSLETRKRLHRRQRRRKMMWCHQIVLQCALEARLQALRWVPEAKESFYSEYLADLGFSYFAWWYSYFA